ncbi:hypothetical protein [Candidatus Tisiphia endosymbiont of Metellina segmentata]|uniref:hypothetical protein n=1 Tax=Candidatus Tisiphia endosymbiont of Metellina segmentata TaxID=3066274 RepID=UPI00313E67C4
MNKKAIIPEVSVKSTKEQILAAYNDALAKLNEKQLNSPQDQKKQQEKQELVSKASDNSSDNILSELSSLKSKTIKQIDHLSEQLLSEFEKLANLREAIILEQKHLQELYQINENANSLSALLQAQVEQKEYFEQEMKQKKQDFEQEMNSQKSHWQQQRTLLEQDYKEQKELLSKTRKREEEEYNYALELKRRKDSDEYNNKRTLMEKELLEAQDNLLKRETDLTAKEQEYASLKMQVDEMADKIKEAVYAAEELLRNQLLQQYDFEKQLKQQEYEGVLKLKDQSILYLEDKIKKQEITIQELTAKADNATQQVQSIAYRALDTSGQRFVTLTTTKNEEKGL